MSFLFEYDEEAGVIRSNGKTHQLHEPQAFELLSRAWLRSGWDTKYVYGFSWLGRPIIQLPEDIIRIQELIYQLKPDVIVETGVAHGGSLVLYAGLCAAMSHGRVIGIDIDIRSHNRKAIESHRMSPLISLVEGSSISPEIFNSVKSRIGEDETVLVILDSNHSRDHVLSELKMYSGLIKPGGYIVACDGIMQDVVGAPRSEADWDWNNPVTAVNDFLSCNQSFEIVEPIWPFNEGSISSRVSYWPQAYLRRKN